VTTRRLASDLLVAGSVAWLALAAAGVAVAVGWRDRLLALLPPLAIDADAVGGALTVISIGAIGIGVAHAAIAAGIRGGRRWALSAGILLASVLGAGFVALAAAAATSAIRESTQAGALGASAIVAGLAAACYGLIAMRLVTALRSGSAH
jgi:hypothetical protein